MKKLLVLLLVLCVTGASQAALTDFDLSLNGTTLTVVGLTAGATLNYGVYDETGTINTCSLPKAILADGSGGQAAGALAAILGPYTGGTYSGFNMIVMDTTPSTDAVDAMDWFTIDYDGSVGDVITIYDNGAPGSPLIGTKTIIPEPVTIALLGLGGLFLRRRK